MPKYILHTVQKEDTLWGISKKYKVEEHKIVQANPDKIKLQKRGSKYTPVIYEGDVLRIPQDTEETNSYKIEGKASLGMGESTEYQLLDSEGDIPHYPSGKISWQFHVDEGSENWRQLRLEKEKTGQKFTIVFTNQKLKSKKIRIEAYFKGQDGSQKLVEFLMVLDGEDIPEIKKLELLDANRNLIKRKLSYAETLFARAQCTGMEGETLYFSLWEDDAPGAGHSKENEENFIATKPAQVVNGRAEVSFSLIYSTMAPIANRKIPAGQKDEGPYHEYYVTVTRYEATEPEKSSKNVDVNNPDYVPLPPKPKPKKKETPKTQPQAQPKKKEPQVIHKDKVNAPAKPPASAWKEPKIIKVYIRDTQGKVWTRRPKYGEKIWVMVESQNLIDKKIKLKLYDKDKFSNDLLYEEDRYISQNLNRITVTLTKEMQDKGGDVWYQNIFAEVSLYDTKQTVKSEVIDVDKTDFSLPKPEGINPVTKKAPEQQEGKEKCPNCDSDFTLNQLQLVFTNVSSTDLNLLLKSLNTYRQKFELNTCVRKAHFFAQCIEESGRDLKGALIGESLNYTPEQLVDKFDNFRSKYVKGSSMQNSTYMGYNGERLNYDNRKKSKPIPEAYTYGKYNGKDANQKKVAIIAYGNRNGNITSEDAWNFRGRGLLQITGRENYRLVQKQIDKRAPESNVNVFSPVPESGYSPHQAAITGMAEWVHKNLYSLASQATKNNDDEVVNNIVSILNNATDSRSKRIVHYRGGTASAKNSAKYTAPKDKNGKPKYKPTKEIFEVDGCILLAEGKKAMKKENGKRAPWVDVAFAEFNKYKGLKEKESPLKEKITEYFNSSSTKGRYSDPWCGAYIVWCFEQTNDFKNINDSVSALAFGWLSKNWKKGEDSEIFVGATIIFNFSHVAFLIGENLDGTKYVYLGGNQGNGDSTSGNQKICMGSISKNSKKIVGITKPKDYTITDIDKKLPKYDISAENSKESSR